jgi:AAA domain-containing protein
LREDQAAAALSVLTDGRRVSVLNAPAGAGKTRVLAEIAKAWQGAGLGPVIGITASQSARNTLAAGGIESYNSAWFLGHLPGGRGAQGHRPIAEGTLLAVDEASMMTTLDLADLIALAEQHSGKVIAAGDTEQLQAVEGGGGMSLLADRLGYVRLAEPVRFRAAWERAASLRLRDGDATVVEEYDQHGRIVGGDPELMTESAADEYTALTVVGGDALLIAADHALRRELCRRVRENLLRLGLVDATQTVNIADGTEAGRGDLILCTRNHHGVEAGEPGRTLANGDLLRIDAITTQGLLVRRALDADRQTGQRRWTDRQFLFADYADAELGYAVTGHVAQGRTVRAGLAVFTGSEDRQHAYVALSRGTHDNTAYVYTTPVKLADLTPGTRPAPELARYDQLATPADHPDSVNRDDPGTTSPANVLAEIIAGRDGARQSAAQPWRQALSDADHLAVLHAVWAKQTTLVREQRYRALLQSALPPGTGQQPSHKEQWLHRTLRAVELAGLDPGEVLTRAVAERNLVGARDPAAVVDARIRRRHPDLVPLSAAAWSTQIPHTDDPDRRRFLAQLATVMDDRRRRIGEHAAASNLPWAVTALGSIPDDPAARLAWQHKAAAIGTYRELSGHDHPDDPAGPEPPANNPDLRVAWHAARTAFAPDETPEVRTAEPRAHAKADAAHSHGEREGAVRQASQLQGHGQESRLSDLAEVSRRIGELAARRRELIAGMAERQSPPVPVEDPGLLPSSSPGFPFEAAQHRTAILQPPKPEMIPSPRILDRAAERDRGWEAAD